MNYKASQSPSLYGEEPAQSTHVAAIRKATAVEPGYGYVRAGFLHPDIRRDLASYLLLDHPSLWAMGTRSRRCGPAVVPVDGSSTRIGTHLLKLPAGHFSVGSATHRVASIRRWWAARMESRPCSLCRCKSAVAETALQRQAIHRMMSSSDTCAPMKPMRSPLYSGRVIGMSPEPDLEGCRPWSLRSHSCLPRYLPRYKVSC